MKKKSKKASVTSLDEYRDEMLAKPIYLAIARSAFEAVHSLHQDFLDLDAVDPTLPERAYRAEVIDTLIVFLTDWKAEGSRWPLHDESAE